MMRRHIAEHTARGPARRLSWPIAAALLVSGCAGGTGWQQEYEALAEAPVCCATPADFLYEKLPVDARLERDIGTASEAFSFMGEKSFFASFELPRSSRPLLLTVEADMPWKGFPRSYAMFYPAVLFLDEDKQPVSFLPPSEAEYVSHDLLNADRLQAEIVVDPKAGWRYFVIFTTPDSLRAGMPVRIKSAPYVANMIPAGPGVFIPVTSDRSGETRDGAPGAPVARIKVAAEELHRLSSTAP
jgi:hypothetical protein